MRELRSTSSKPSQDADNCSPNQHSDYCLTSNPKSDHPAKLLTNSHLSKLCDDVYCSELLINFGVICCTATDKYRPLKNFSSYPKIGIQSSRRLHTSTCIFLSSPTHDSQVREKAIVISECVPSLFIYH